MKLLFSFILTTLLTILTPSLLARDQIGIVGSSTVYPFTTVVAERFGRASDFKTPKIESTGTGGGMKLFCAGIGPSHPDITNASRRIKPSEVELCGKNGVDKIVELQIGFDGIAIASDIEKGPNFDLTTENLFLALAKDIVGSDGKLVPNPYTHWNQINKDYPAIKIEVLGPPPTSGTRDALAELALERGAKAFPVLTKLKEAKDEAEVKAIMTGLGFTDAVFDSIKASKGTVKGKSIFKLISHSVREDGAYIEAGENDNLIIQKIQVNPTSLGIFGYSFLEQNEDVIKAHVMDGVELSFESIVDGDYPIARSLFVYIKAQHVNVIPGMMDFIKEYTSEEAMGEDGYLVDKGLIPLSNEKRAVFTKNAVNLVPFSL